MSGILIKRRNLEIERHTGRMPGEHQDRDRGGASTNQGMPEIPSKPLE